MCRPALTSASARASSARSSASSSCAIRAPFAIATGIEKHGDYAVTFVEANDDVTTLESLYRSVDNLTLAIDEFVVDLLSLGERV